jgi:RNA polymerase sigma-70 factor (ECF subfamily)
MDAALFAQHFGRAQQGDRAAGERLFSLLSPGLLRQARRVLQAPLRTKLDAEDVVQDTLLTAWERLGQFQGSTPFEFTAWMRRILASQLSRAVRRYRGTRTRDIRRECTLAACSPSSFPRLAEPAASHTTPSQHAVRAEVVRRVDRALATLPEHYRLVLDWHERQGVPLLQIAEHLGRSEEAVRKLWSRALLSLHRALNSLP